jgi:hypothetical protein
VLALLVLSLAPCDVRLALRPGRASSRFDASDFTWPLRLIQVFVAQVYIFSAYSKVVVSGWHWLSSVNIRNFLLILNEQDQIAVFHRFGMWLAGQPALCLAIGIATLALEVGFVGVLFSHRWRRVLLITAVGFHAGVLFAMNIFFSNVALLPIYVDWQRLAARFRKNRRPTPPPSVQIPASARS